MTLPEGALWSTKHVHQPMCGAGGRVKYPRNKATLHRGHTEVGGQTLLTSHCAVWDDSAHLQSEEPGRNCLSLSQPYPVHEDTLG